MTTNTNKERIIMKTTFRQFVVYMVLLVGLVLVPVGVHAADNEVGVSVSYSTVNEEGFDNGFGFGINYTRAIMPNAAVEVGIDRKTFDLEVGGASVTTMPIRITGLYRFEQMGTIRPWVGGGVGYYLNETDASFIDEAINEVNDICDVGGLDCSYSGSADLKDAFGFHLVGGADYPINEKFALTLGLEYRIVSADPETKFSCSGSDCTPLIEDELTSFAGEGSSDLGGFDLKIGVKYMF